ncbi:MAG: MaoC family dehydratase N-terminal domain-containing protein [Rhizobiaceae bacterium]
MNKHVSAVPAPPAGFHEEQRTFVLPIDHISARRFAHASTLTDPIYFDDEAARKAGYEKAIAPITFISSMLDYTDGPPEHELKEDGVGRDLFPSMVKPDALLMGGGQDIEFVRPVYQGDVVTVVRKAVNHYKRPSPRFGELDFVVEESVCTNQKGEVVMRISDTLIVKQD